MSESKAQTKLRVAHIREQNVDLIIVPLNAGFGTQSPDQQQAGIEAIRKAAAAANLAGDVIPVWDAGGGRMSFIALKPYHPYFQSINLEFVFANLNQDLLV